MTAIREPESSTDRQQAPRIIPLTDWPRYHPWPPLGGLRHLVFHAKATGFDRVVKRAGRRVLIDERAFFKWLDERNLAPHAR